MQSVIVYRNPLEAMVWESLMNGGFVIVLVFILAALVGVGVYSLIEKHTRYTVRPWGRNRAISTNVRDFLERHNGKISIAASVVSVYLVHLANIKGWI